MCVYIHAHEHNHSLFFKLPRWLPCPPGFKNFFLNKDHFKSLCYNIASVLCSVLFFFFSGWGSSTKKIFRNWLSDDSHEKAAQHQVSVALARSKSLVGFRTSSWETAGLDVGNLMFHPLPTLFLAPGPSFQCIVQSTGNTPSFVALLSVFVIPLNINKKVTYSRLVIWI